MHLRRPNAEVLRFAQDDNLTFHDDNLTLMTAVLRMACALVRMTDLTPEKQMTNLTPEKQKAGRLSPAFRSEKLSIAELS
jgi:hypothetical protein